MLSQQDKVNLNSLVSIIANNVKFSDLDVKQVSALYHSLKWLQELGPNLDKALDCQRMVEEFPSILDKECEGLREYIKELEFEISELKKPKTRTRKKKVSK